LPNKFLLGADASSALTALVADDDEKKTYFIRCGYRIAIYHNYVVGEIVT